MFPLHKVKVHLERIFDLCASTCAFTPRLTPMVHGTSIGMGYRKLQSLLPASLGSSLLIHELHLELVAFSTSLPSPVLMYPFSFSISQ